MRGTPDAEHDGRGGVRRAETAVLLQAVVVVAVFAAVGAAGGWVWYHLWDVPPGVAFQGQWVPRESDEGLQAAFDGTAWYVVCGLVAGLVLGVLAALLARRSEVATLVAVVIGAAVAAWLAYRVGLSLSPPDPAPLARGADDYTPIPGALSISGRSPFVAWPLGAVLGLAVVYLLGLSAGEVRRREQDTAWMPGAGSGSGPGTARSSSTSESHD